MKLLLRYFRYLIEVQDSIVSNGHIAGSAKAKTAVNGAKDGMNNINCYELWRHLTLTKGALCGRWGTLWNLFEFDLKLKHKNICALVSNFSSRISVRIPHFIDSEDDCGWKPFNSFIKSPLSLSLVSHFDYDFYWELYLRHSLWPHH